MKEFLISNWEILTIIVLLVVIIVLLCRASRGECSCCNCDYFGDNNIQKIYDRIKGVEDIVYELLSDYSLVNKDKIDEAKRENLESEIDRLREENKRLSDACCTRRYYF